MSLTPQEKALEIYRTYERLGRDFTRGVSMKEHSKRCALLAVDEAMEALKYGAWNNGQILKYYDEIKQEIEKL